MIISPSRVEIHFQMYPQLAINRKFQVPIAQMHMR
jgi:hypothetical protein